MRQGFCFCLVSVIVFSCYGLVSVIMASSFMIVYIVFANDIHHGSHIVRPVHVLPETLRKKMRVMALTTAILFSLHAWQVPCPAAYC